MKKGLALAAAFIILLLVLVHTPVMERPLLGLGKRILAGQGIELAAQDIQLNLFRLSVVLRDARLTSPYVSGRFGELRVNGSSGLLTGDITFDRLLLENAELTVNYPFPDEGQTPTRQPKIPNIWVGQLDVKETRVLFRDHQQPVDGHVRDLTIRYRDDTLLLSFDLPPSAPYGHDLPLVEAALVAKTHDFLNYHKIQLDIQSQRSRIEVNGNISLIPLSMDLQAEAHLEEDLTHMAGWADVTAKMDPDTLSLDVKGIWNQEQFHLPLELETEFAWRESPRHIPVKIRAGQYGEGEVDATWTEDALDATWQCKVAFESWIPPQETANWSRTDFSGSAHVPLADPGQTQADFELNALGFPEILVRGRLDSGALTGDARIALDSCGSLNTRFRLEQDLNLQFQGELEHLGCLEPFLPAAKNYHSEAVFLSGAVSTDFRNVTLAPSCMVIHQLDAGQWTDTLRLDFQGPLHNLEGQLKSQVLQNLQAHFSANVESMIWHEVCLDLQDATWEQDGIQILVSTHAHGSGPLTQPDFEAEVKTTIKDQKYGVWGVGRGRFFSREDQMIAFEDVEITSGGVNVTGRGRFSPDLTSWGADFQVKCLPETSVPFLPGLPLPELTLLASGNQREFRARLYVPGQTMEWPESRLSLAAPTPLDLFVSLDQAAVTEIQQVLYLAGFQLSNMGASLQEDRLDAHAHFSLRDSHTFNKAFSQFLPPDLYFEQLEGDIRCSSDPSFECPVISVDLIHGQGQFRNEPFQVENLVARYDEAFSFEPFQVKAAGMVLQFMDPGLAEESLVQAVEQLENRDLHADVSLPCSFDLQSPADLLHFISPDLPTDVKLASLSGFAKLELLEGFTSWRLSVGVDNLDAHYGDMPITAHDLGFHYDGQLASLPGEIQIQGRPLRFLPNQEGFQFSGTLTTAHLKPLIPDLLGGTLIDVHCDVALGASDTVMTARLEQGEGSLILEDPWLEVENLNLKLEVSDNGAFSLSEGGAAVNGGSVHLSGTGNLLDTPATWALECLGDHVTLEIMDFMATLTFSLAWTKTPDDQSLTGALLVKDGFFSPRQTWEKWVKELVAGQPTVYFPDPLLSGIRLELSVLTLNPLIVDHNMAYLEVESPSVLLTGTLAEPDLFAGSVFISEGSEIKLGKDLFIFQASQIQFHPNRPGEPYLQIYMEYGDFGDKKPIQLLGYISDLENSLDSGHLATFFANFLLGRLSSYVSLESETNETLFDSSFAVVLSQPLGRKLVTRYAIPLSQQNAQRFELGVGPFAGMLLNVIYKENETAYDLRYLQKLGNPANTPPTIARIEITGPADRSWVKKHFEPRRGDIFSETRLRSAVTALQRAWIYDGYLNPSIDADFENRIIHLNADPGPQTQIDVTGLTLTQEELRDLFALIRNAGDNPLDRMPLRLRQQAIRHGFRSSDVEITREGHRFSITVIPGPPIGSPRVHLGEATDLLKDLVDPKLSREFVIDYLLEPGSVESLIRGRLAAKGFVNASMGEARFLDSGDLVLPISLGPKARLSYVEQRGDAPVLGADFFRPWLQQPFSHELILDLMAALTRKSPSDVRYSVEPHRTQEDVWLEITSRKLVEPTYDTLQVVGNQRISTEKVLDFLDFTPGMPQSDLNKAQENLIRAGPFRAVRLFGEDHVARLELAERNRWDLGYGVQLNEREELTLVAQAKDRIFLKGFNDLTFRGERSNYDREASIQALFRKIFHSPFDLYVRASWDDTSRDDTPEDVILSFYAERRFTFPENRRLVLEFRYPFARYHEIKLGTNFWRIINHDVSKLHDNFDILQDEPLDDSFVFDTFESTNTSNLLPLQLSWVFNKLDHKANPQNGYLASVGVEYFTDASWLGSTSEVEGPRYSASYTQFKSFGHFLWTQRLKLGLYRPQIALAPSGSERDPVLFFLGGPTTLRGYKQDQVGPFDEREEHRGFTGGECMFFFSQELTYHTPWYGLSITPFLDAGQVWATYDDATFSDLLYTTGLGLSWDSPAGYIRLDWALRLEEQPPHKDADPFKDWHLRFGRSF